MAEVGAGKEVRITRNDKPTSVGRPFDVRTAGQASAAAEAGAGERLTGARPLPVRRRDLAGRGRGPGGPIL